MADKDAAIGLCIVTLQRLDAPDGGICIVHRLETVPESRCVRLEVYVCYVQVVVGAFTIIVWAPK